MTARSERRAAELKVIDVARALVQTERLAHPYGRHNLWPLAEVLDELDALGLETPGRARANKGAPVTAQQAAIWMDGDKARSVCARIIRLLWRHGPLPEETIEKMLNGKHQTVSPRLTDLRDTGWIIDSGYKLQTSSGRLAIAWQLSHAARQAINGQEGMPI